MMTPSPEQRLETWLTGTIPEGQHLDFKATLHASTTAEKRELLKDLTAMGNGGGGTIAFGVAERKDGDLSLADHLEPMTDRQLMTSVASLLIDTIRPTLIWRTTVIEVDGGVVLVVEVDPSPMGPYMVQYKGDHRY